MEGRNRIVLENQILQIEILPEYGGKIVSFYRKDAGFELAARREGGIPETAEGADFSRFAFGMDDAFPNIDPEEIVWKGRRLRYPDHGETWSHQTAFMTGYRRPGS